MSDFFPVLSVIFFPPAQNNLLTGIKLSVINRIILQKFKKSFSLPLP
jgi:hypothetical protein